MFFSHYFLEDLSKLMTELFGAKILTTLLFNQSPQLSSFKDVLDTFPNDISVRNYIAI